MEKGNGVPTKSPVRSPVQSPTLHRAAGVPTDELLRALMAAVGNLTLSVAQTKARQAHTDQHMHAVSDFLAREGGAALNFTVNLHDKMGVAM